MEELTHVEHNCETGETIVRPLTDEERAEYQKNKELAEARYAQELVELQEKEALKVSARAKLVSGTPLTEEEAAIIIL